MTEKATNINQKNYNAIKGEMLQNNTKTEIIDYDDLLSSAGKFGCYQLLLFMATLPFFVFGAFLYFSQLFITEVSPNHWCWIPELGNLSTVERRNLAVPSDDSARFGYSRCESYMANWSEVLETGIRPNASWETVPCQHGWEFNKSEIPYPTISSELSWVCDKSSYQATAQAAFFVGSVVGCLVIGWIADRFGRLSAAVISNMVACVAGIVTTFSSDFYQFTACRFFLGISNDSSVMIVYLLMLEYVAPKCRTIVSSLAYALFYGPAAATMPWIALECGHWKIFSLITSAPMAIFLLTPWILPESPRWLLSKGRVDDAVEKVLTISRINKKPIPASLVENFKLSQKFILKETNVSLLELFRRPLLRKSFICIVVFYSVTTIVFDALVRSVGQLQFDFFVSFSLVTGTEIPALLLTALIMDKVGRKLLSITVLSVACIFSTVTPFLDGGVTSVTCIMIAKFFANVAYGASTQWCAEILPTPVRATGSSFVHIIGNAMAILSPYIVYLDNYVYWLPLVLVGVICAAGAVAVLMIPETANKELPQTFEDAEILHRSQQLIEIPFLKREKKFTTEHGLNNVSFECEK